MTSTRPFSLTTTAPVAVPGPMTAVDVAPALPPVDPSPNESEPTHKWRRWLLPVVVVVAVASAGAALMGWLTQDGEDITSNQVDEAIDEAFSSTTVPAPVGPAVYNAIIPSLVFVENGESGQDGASIGSGVIINADGNIMTSNHVVDGAGSIRVTFADGTSSEARIVQSVPDIDIAVLEAQQLPDVVVPAVLGGGVRVGDPVFAIGNPLGLGGSFSAGVVSGLDRTLPLADDRELAELIQFDAAVNPGSSGGPLLDRNAQVVGIVTAIANPTGEDFFSGIGFAVPIATAGGAAGGPEQ